MSMDGDGRGEQPPPESESQFQMQRPTFAYDGEDSANTPPSAGVEPPVPAGPSAVADFGALRRQAAARAEVTQSPQRLSQWLVEQGLPEVEAEKLATEVWDREMGAKRKADADAAAQRRTDVIVGTIEVAAGLGLLVAGLMLGWFVGLFILVILDGLRRIAV